MQEPIKLAIEMYIDSWISLAEEAIAEGRRRPAERLTGAVHGALGFASNLGMYRLAASLAEKYKQLDEKLNERWPEENR